jgi:hypothetical protein
VLREEVVGEKRGRSLAGGKSENVVPPGSYEQVSPERQKNRMSLFLFLVASAVEDL